MFLVIVRQFFAFVCLICFFYVGSWLQVAFSIPLPGALIGLILFFIVLLPMRRIPTSVLFTGQLLLKHLSLFFIPATLSVFIFKDTLQQHILLISVVLFTSTLISLVVSALICHFGLKGQPDD